MSRVQIVECDRCGETAPVDEAEGWADMVFGVGSGELRADLCPPCFAGLQRYLDGDDAVTLIDVPMQGEPEIIEIPMVFTREQAERLARHDFDEALAPGKARDATIIEEWHKGTTTREIGKLIGTSAGRVSQLAHGLGLPARRRGRHKSAQKRVWASGGTQRRHTTPTSGRSVSLPPEHDAVTEGRTLFPSTVVDVADSPRVLIDGVNQRKIGRMGAIVIDDPAAANGAVVCPAQTGKTDCCATCALCWTMNKPVAFLRHGEAVAAALD